MAKVWLYINIKFTITKMVLQDHIHL